MKILAVSDVEIGFIYSPMICERFKDIDLIISCGDLPYYYLEYILTMLNLPLFYVRGNHSSKTEYGSSSTRNSPWGAIDLHQKCIRSKTGILLAGLEGSLMYNRGPQQYTQSEYWQMVFLLVPGLLINKIRTGRYLDIFVAHAPPWQIHDADDKPHTGIKAFRWLIKVFQPFYFLHGHIHVYRTGTITQTKLGGTTVINSYGYKELDFSLPLSAQPNSQVR